MDGGKESRSTERRPGKRLGLNPQTIESEQKFPQKSLLLIFGQGPVVDSETRIKAQEAGTIPGSEDIVFWSKDLARAAVELSKHDPDAVNGGIVIMGGKTGGERYKSEAELIAEKIRNDLPEKKQKEDEKLPDIITEKDSLDTIENIINFLNQRDGNGISNDEKVQRGEFKLNLLSVSYHLLRIQTIMKLFCVPVGNVFPSDEVIRFSARVDKDKRRMEGISEITDDSTKWDHKTLAEFEHKIGLYGAGFFEKQKGTEARDYQERALYDNLWLRELLERPDAFLSRVNMVNSDTRLMSILEKFEGHFLGILKKKDIDLSDSMDVIRKRLHRVSYKG
jgi:hypothetical protein